MSILLFSPVLLSLRRLNPLPHRGSRHASSLSSPMLPSPSASIQTPLTAAAAGTKRPAASDLQRTAGAQATTPSKRHATTKASTVAGPHTISAFALGGVAAPPSLGAPVANMSHAALPNNSHSIPQVPAPLTEDQLLGRSPEQLVATILQVQAQHQQYIAAISAQYDSITQQLSDMRGSLAALYSTQASHFQNAASVRTIHRHVSHFLLSCTSSPLPLVCTRRGQLTRITIATPRIISGLLGP